MLDYESRFRASVIDEFADAYLAGATPVPCIRCNERVKFRDLLETARDLGADCMATGHYVRRVDGAGAGRSCTGRRTRRATRAISCSPPRREQLDYLRFPLGGLASKAETRRAGGALRAAGGGEAGQPGHLLRAERVAMPR